MSEDLPWSTIVLGLGAAVFAVAVVKSLTDASSSWESYAFVGLAAAIAAGAYLDWAAARQGARADARAQAPRNQLSRLTRSTRSSPGPS